MSHPHIYGGMCLQSCKAKTETVCPQHSNAWKGRNYLRRAGDQQGNPEPGTGRKKQNMEVGEWQHEVRQGVRRMVVRREQGAVGSVSRGEWGN